MMVSVEAAGGLERRMRVQVPAERVDKEVDARLRNVGRTAKLKGFRPGKVPMKVVRQHYGGRVRREVISEVMQSTFTDAIERQKLRPAGGPRIEPDSLEAGKDLAYTATFEVYPEIELRGLEGIAVMRSVAGVSEADIDDMLDNLRAQNAEWHAVDRPAQEGDQVIIDFEGHIDGTVFEGGMGQAVPVVLGAGRMLPDFESGLAGITAGEERSLQVNFPGDYPSKEVAGKAASFVIEARAVQERVLPDMDEAFLARFGVAEGGLEKLRAEVAANMQRELEAKIRAQIRRQVLDGLLIANPLELPGAPVEEEVRSMQEDSLQRMGITDRTRLPPPEPFREQARRRVALGLLIGKLIEDRGIEVDSGRVRERIDELAADYEDPAAMARSLRANAQLMRGVETAVLEQQAVEWLLERANVSETSMSFKDIMGV
ncbi:MAG: trigger factor [Gammaproteobacteria bacterium]|nr:trigger factor [Gammaproteobacteria bacterium]